MKSKTMNLQLFLCVLVLGRIAVLANGQTNSTVPTPALVEVVEPEISASNATAVEGGKNTKRTCACEDNTAESLLCASNGITYKSQCRFQCAKARVSRLRIVKQGQCAAGAGSGSYWQKGFKGRK